MVARLDRNLRSGGRAEDACADILRAYCAVAPVPQKDDTGFDALCTLLHGRGRTLTPGRSFLVQTKGHSVRHIDYDAGDLEWLAKLELPLFFARVNRLRNALDIFTSERLLAGPFARESCFRVVFKPPPHPGARTAGPDVWSPQRHEYHVGPPILSLPRSDDADPLQLALLDEWVTLAQRNIAARSEGRFPVPPAYETNARPEQRGVATFAITREQIVEVARRLNPLLWHFRSGFALPWESNPTAAAIDAVHKMIRDLGVQPLGWFGHDRPPAEGILSLPRSNDSPPSPGEVPDLAATAAQADSAEP